MGAVGSTQPIGAHAVVDPQSVETDLEGAEVERAVGAVHVLK